jgi:hypothetical protein
MSFFHNVSALDVVANSIVIQEDAKHRLMSRERSSAHRARSPVTRMRRQLNLLSHNTGAPLSPVIPSRPTAKTKTRKAKLSLVRWTEFDPMNTLANRALRNYPFMMRFFASYLPLNRLHDHKHQTIRTLRTVESIS